MSVTKKVRDRLRRQGEENLVDSLVINVSNSTTDDIDGMSDNGYNCESGNMFTVEADATASSQATLDNCDSENITMIDEAASQATTDTTGPMNLSVESASQVVERRKKIKFKCLKCGKFFLKKNYARNHCIKERKAWTCEVCGTEIRQTCNIKRHKQRCSVKINSSIKENKKDTCVVCNKEFPSKGNMLRHLRQNHGRT